MSYKKQNQQKKDELEEEEEEESASEGCCECFGGGYDTMDGTEKCEHCDGTDQCACPY